MELANCIYRFLNKDNEVIYIGKAKNLKNRLNTHSHLPEMCYNERVKVEFCMFDTEDEMDFAERYFIPKIKPKYNTVFKERAILFNIPQLDNISWYEFGSCKYIHSQLLIKLKERIVTVPYQYDILHKMKDLKNKSMQYKCKIDDIQIKIDNLESKNNKLHKN